MKQIELTQGKVALVDDIDHSSHLQPGPVDMLSPAIFVFGFSGL